MNGSKLLGVVLLVLGILAVAYGGFTYTKDTDKVDIGPIHLTVKDKEHVNIPLWAGIAAAIVGGIMVASPSKKNG
ncbi:MAG: hypothetical protein ABIR28_12275 [Vicinamibacteria bacterium]